MATTFGNDSAGTGALPRWYRGERITAARLNQMQELLQSPVRAPFGRFVPGTPATEAIIQVRIYAAIASSSDITTEMPYHQEISRTFERCGAHLACFRARNLSGLPCNGPATPAIVDPSVYIPVFTFGPSVRMFQREDGQQIFGAEIITPWYTAAKINGAYMLLVTEGRFFQFEPTLVCS